MIDSRERPALASWIALGIVLCLAAPLPAQSSRKPQRAKAPDFQDGQFGGVFFSDAASLLQGELPSAQSALRTAASTPDQVVPQPGGSNSQDPNDSRDPMAWKNLISPDALEDLIKGAKLRLDRVVTTPAAFKGGGFASARKEFSLQALLFAIIETYPGDVRWKKSAAIARELLSRVAANTKVGSDQVYQEAKKRMLDLDDLLNGSPLAGEARSETDWSKLIDRVPLMQLLQWAQQEHVSNYTGSQSAFEENREQLQRYAELIAVLGKVAMEEEMPDATDDDYVAFAKEMIRQAQQIGLAVQTNDAELARQASGKLGQSCADCHDNFR